MRYKTPYWHDARIYVTTYVRSKRFVEAYRCARHQRFGPIGACLLVFVVWLQVVGRHTLSY
jgi:hypothetical protein